MVIIIRGIPGSGKSTYAENHFKGILHLENDQFHMVDGKYQYQKENQPLAVKTCFDMAKMAVERGMDVVICNTFTRRDFIVPYKRLAENHGEQFRVIRLENRFQNVHNVPENVLKSMESNFEDWENEEIVKE